MVDPSFIVVVAVYKVGTNIIQAKESNSAIPYKFAIRKYTKKPEQISLFNSVANGPSLI